MKSSISSTIRALSLIMVCAVAMPAAHAGDWRQARVLGVSTLSEVDSAVDLTCAPSRPNQPDLKVAVVSFRVGKSLRWRAFNLSPDDRYAAGEEVVVNLVDCSIARQPQPADTTASGPGVVH